MNITLMGFQIAIDWGIETPCSQPWSTTPFAPAFKAAGGVPGAMLKVVDVSEIASVPVLAPDPRPWWASHEIMRAGGQAGREGEDDTP